MAGRGTSLFLVSLMLLSLLTALPSAPLMAHPFDNLEETEALFQGFTHDVPFLESDHAVNKSTLELIETLK